MTNELFDLSGKVAIVTGTSRGLGQYMARALAKAGADLVLTSRKRADLAEFEREILRERTRAGLAHARQKGKRLGRPATAALHAAEIGKLHRAGVSKSEIARRVQVGRTSVRRILGAKS